MVDLFEIKFIIGITNIIEVVFHGAGEFFVLMMCSICMVDFMILEDEIWFLI